MKFFVIIGALAVCSVGAVGIWYIINNLTFKSEQKGKRK